MAITFARASTEYYKVDASPVSAYPITMSVWARCTDANWSGAFSIATETADPNDDTFVLQLNQGSGFTRVFCRRANTTGVALVTAAFSQNTWIHCCAILDSASSRTFIRDGDWAGRGTNTNNLGGWPTIDNMTLGGEVLVGGASNSMEGQAAEAAIWNVALNQAEVEALAAGAPAPLIRPSGLRSYFPMPGDTGTQRNRFAPTSTAYDCVVNGTPTRSSLHPPIFKPQRAFMPAPSVGVTNAISYGFVI